MDPDPAPDPQHCRKGTGVQIRIRKTGKIQEICEDSKFSLFVNKKTQIQGSKRHWIQDPEYYGFVHYMYNSGSFFDPHEPKKDLDLDLH